jgi:hypothetical protein
MKTNMKIYFFLLFAFLYSCKNNAQTQQEQKTQPVQQTELMQFPLIPESAIKEIVQNTNHIEAQFLGNFHGSMMIEKENVPSFLRTISMQQVPLNTRFPSILDAFFQHDGNEICIGTIYSNGHQAYIVFEYKKQKYGHMLTQEGVNMFNNIMNNNVEVMHKDK